MENQQPSAAKINSSLHIDIDAITKELLPHRIRIHRLPPHMRMNKQDDPSVYDPISVSLGPYHHGKPEFSRAEKFKHLCLHWLTNADDERKDHLYGLVLNKVGLVRDCYADVSVVNKYDDNALALMMLLDACFIINFMKIHVSDEIANDSYNCLGVAAALPLAGRDIMLLENQIPFFILKLLLLEIMQDATAKRLLASFLIAILSVEKEEAEIPEEDAFPPLHILEACRRVLTGSWRVLVDSKCHSKYRLRRLAVSSEGDVQSRLITWYKKKRIGSATSEVKSSYASRTSNFYTKCPSVTYLKAKGIHFHPKSTHFLRDITFTSHGFSGLLQLPVCYVSNLTFVYLSNMIAYEIAPTDNVDFSPDLTVLSYVSFMKSLIQTPADVIELQEKGLLRLNRFANHKQVVQIFKSIETFNLRNVNIYQDVMYKVGVHCDNKAKTWMADLIHSRLKSPWTITGLLSATLLLVLAFLQTYYTVIPSPKHINYHSM